MSTSPESDCESSNIEEELYLAARRQKNGMNRQVTRGRLQPMLGRKLRLQQQSLNPLCRHLQKSQTYYYCWYYWLYHNYFSFIFFIIFLDLLILFLLLLYLLLRIMHYYFLMFTFYAWYLPNVVAWRRALDVFSGVCLFVCSSKW